MTLLSLFSSASFHDLDPLQVRSSIDQRCLALVSEVPAVASIRELTVECAGVSTPLRVYMPDVAPRSLLLFIHGGAWVAGSLDTHDNLARYLCANVGAVVVSVGYCNAPEGKFPLPLEQCYGALQWAVENVKEDRRVAVVGDSAGGNLAAALCLLARDRAGPHIDTQVLINPALDLTCGGTLEPQGEMLDLLRWQATMYVDDPIDVFHPYVSPLLAGDLSGLPQSLVLLAECDNLREEGQQYADRLTSVGVPTEVYCQKNVPHLAAHAASASSVARESLDVAVNFLRGDE